MTKNGENGRTVEEIRNGKKRLRQWAREKRSAMKPEQAAAADVRIEERVLSLPEYQQARTVMVYMSLPGEPETRGIIRDAVRQGKRVLLPRCLDSRRMEAALFRGFERLRPGRMGIPEPAADTPEESSRTPEADLILVPCVAASGDGKRLGHGAGYYDRFLKNATGKTVCLCYQDFLAEDLPVNDEDVLMDMVVTEQTTVRREEKKAAARRETRAPGQAKNKRTEVREDRK